MKRQGLVSRGGGFTLIELLVVIAIIGILSSVVVASLNGARKKARDARRVDDVKQLQLALDLYFDSSAAGGKYPTNLDAVAAGGFIPKVPKDPDGVTAYKYAPLSSCTSYHLGTTLEDTGNIALNSKKGQGAGTVSTGCPGGGTTGTDFDGAPATVYDVVP
ncbi:MAG: general secretion pathway protein G [Parcubacteria group bacterium Gr01-1014_17]|nr:MAG: general secretion pathway protein G [Parcubacteria group bacterium Gr01-1014_17]